MNLGEVMDMPPWMLEVKLLQIKRDLDEREQQLKRQQAGNLGI